MEDIVGLRHIVQALPCEPVWAKTGDVLSGEAHRSGVASDEAVDRLQHGRLAGSVRPDHGDDLIRIGLERNAAKYLRVVVAGLERVNLEQAHTTSIWAPR